MITKSKSEVQNSQKQNVRFNSARVSPNLNEQNNRRKSSITDSFKNLINDKDPVLNPKADDTSLIKEQKNKDIEILFLKFYKRHKYIQEKVMVTSIVETIFLNA